MKPKILEDSRSHEYGFTLVELMIVVAIKEDKVKKIKGTLPFKER